MLQFQPTKEEILHDQAQSFDEAYDYAAEGNFTAAKQCLTRSSLDTEAALAAIDAELAAAGIEVEDSTDEIPLTESGHSPAVITFDQAIREVS